MTAKNRAMVVAGIATLASVQILFTSLALLQYFCIIDFMRELPLLIFIKVTYFHNPSTCGLRVTIGEAIDGMPDQALILLTRTPLTATRTLYINIASLGLALVWFITCFGIIRGGAIKKESKPVRWPWLIVTVLVSGMDLVATVTYINDTFHTRTLTELVDYIGGITSGTGSNELNTSWVAWTMVLIYSRFVVLFLLNLTLIVIVVIHVSAKRALENTGIQVESQTGMQDAGTLADLRDSSSERADSEAPAPAIPRPGLSHSFRRMKERLFSRQVEAQPRTHDAGTLAEPEDSSSERAGSEARQPVIPRPGLSHSFRRMKERLFSRGAVAPERAAIVTQVDTGHDSIDASPERLENMIAEQRRRLDRAAEAAARGEASGGRESPPRASQSLPHLAPADHDWGARGRRGTAAELQGQLPWAYVPGAAHIRRDQPDEDLPPVPLPDYTVVPAYRKASVHRAASSLSSMTQKREEKAHLPRPPLTSLDVLY